MSLVEDRLSASSGVGSSAKLVLALDNALSMFDGQVKQAIYFHLKQKGVCLEGTGADQIKIEGALRDMLSSGAEIIIACMKGELEKIVRLQ